MTRKDPVLGSTTRSLSFEGERERDLPCLFSRSGSELGEQRALAILTFSFGFQDSFRPTGPRLASEPKGWDLKPPPLPPTGDLGVSLLNKTLNQCSSFGDLGYLGVQGPQRNPSMRWVNTSGEHLGFCTVHGEGGTAPSPGSWSFPSGKIHHMFLHLLRLQQVTLPEGLQTLSFGRSFNQSSLAARSFNFLLLLLYEPSVRNVRPKKRTLLRSFLGSSFLVNWPRIAPIDVDARGYASTLCNPGSPVDHFKKGSDLVIRKKVFLCLAEHGSSNWTFVGFDESPCQGRPPRMPHRVFDLKPGVTGFGSCWLTRMFTTKHLRRAMGSWFWTPRTRFWKRGYGLDTPNMGVPGIYGYQHIQLSRT